MSRRILPRVCPRQSSSSVILFEMSSDADWPWLVSEFFYVLIVEVRNARWHASIYLRQYPLQGRKNEYLARA
jgi:hypothetical protein